MLDQTTRTTILMLRGKGVPQRRIARLLKISRNTVRKVIDSQSPTPAPLTRPQKAEPYQDQILELHTLCKGNLIRVHEELLETGAQISYPALTAYCRRHGIGRKPRPPAGRYRFEPGQEIQHDTSPHTVEIGGKKRRIQTASAVLCFSRMLFFQCSPRFQRFDCKVFLHDALSYFEGAPEVVMIDNTHVIVLSGTGETMVPVPEMEAFAQRYGFRFQAHAIGDVNRSARVERPFHFIETNFLAGRTFADWQELNDTARAWCDKVNQSYKRHLKARPCDLFALERTRLRPLPEWVPEPERLGHRIVDVHGYVTLNTNRYSVPWRWIGRQVQIRETKAQVHITLGHQNVSHPRLIDPLQKWISAPGHHPRRQRPARREPPELQTLREKAPELADYIRHFKKRRKKPLSLTLGLRKLLRMVREYPREPLVAAIREADHYGLYDLDRLESMVLRRIAQEFFRFDNDGEEHD